ncbi:MAG TPA: heavy-metal-associated domain-containing protein [Methylophilaceae bacterium]|nr:heavy-metal-associated domain-containing protein [Methylophilaceae bacterium]
MQIQKLRVSGITCDGWAREVRETLKSVNGVNEVRVTLGSGDAEVSFDERLASPDDVKMALLREGFSFSSPENSGI